MKRVILAIVMMLGSIISYAQQLSPDQITGVWQCDDYKIEIFKTANTYSGKLLWTKDMFEADGKTPRKDSKNPNEKLRSRSMQGVVHITELVYDDGEYIDGKLYSVQDGNTYSLKATLKSVNNLETRGYKGVPMMGRTFKWKRVQ